MCVCSTQREEVRRWRGGQGHQIVRSIDKVDKEIPTNTRFQTRRPDDRRTTRVEVETRAYHEGRDKDAK